MQQEKRYIIGFGMELGFSFERDFSACKQFGISMYINKYQQKFFFLKKAMWVNSNDRSHAEIIRIAGFQPSIRVIKTTIENSKGEKIESTVTTETFEPEAVENRQNIEKFCKLFGFPLNSWKISVMNL